MSAHTNLKDNAFPLTDSKSVRKVENATSSSSQVTAQVENKKAVHRELPVCSYCQAMCNGFDPICESSTWCGRGPKPGSA